MKPHEATLSVMQFDKERRCLVECGQRMVAVFRNHDAADWEAFLLAAPDMARALLDHMRRHAHRTPRCGCETCGDTRTVLAKAGVLP